MSGFQSPRLSSPAPHRAGGECLICNLHVQIQVQLHVYDYWNLHVHVHVVFRKGSFLA